MTSNKVWFVTGASKGLGLILVKLLLNNGNKVAATSRTIADLEKAVDHDSEKFLPLAVDLTNEFSVGQAIEQTIQNFGKIDVIVNNAGYGLGGSIEELSDKEVRQNFDVNVFGTLNVIRQSLPFLRTQKSGHIINIASASGYIGTGGFGGYSATKSAVIGLSEALAEEVQQLGIHVSMIAPGFLRTNFLSSDSVAYAKNEIEAYLTVRDLRTYFDDYSGKQAGDPKKVAEAIVQITSIDNPPVHLLLGSDAYSLVTSKLDSLKSEFEQWKETSKAINFE